MCKVVKYLIVIAFCLTALGACKSKSVDDEKNGAAAMITDESVISETTEALFEEESSEPTDYTYEAAELVEMTETVEAAETPKRKSELLELELPTKGELISDNLEFSITGLEEHEEYYAVKFAITNISDYETECVRISLSDLEWFSDAIFAVVRYPSELMEKMEWSDELKTETKYTVYLPVTFDIDTDVSETSDIRAVQPGESITGIIHY